MRYDRIFTYFQFLSTPYLCIILKGSCLVSKKHFLQGALILTIAALLSRILGLFYRIPLQQMTGDSGLALYNSVYNIFSTILILVVAGIPVALSKMISEQVTIENDYEEKRIIRLSFRFISLVGVITFFILFFSAGIISKWIGMPDAELAIKSVSFTLLIIPILAILRGFFFGHQNIAPSAVSQVVEQFFRVTTILILTFVLVQGQFSLPVVIAGATFGTVVGVFISTIYLGVKYVRFQKSRKENISDKQVDISKAPSMSQTELYKKIVFFTFAISVSSLMIPLFGLADTFTAVNILRRITEDAQNTFGTYTRFLPFIQLTTIFATSLALSLVPKIAESGIQQNNRDISHSAYLALKLTVLLGMPASVGLALLAKEVNLIFYSDELGSMAFAVIALSSFFLTLGITSVAILQGLGKVYLPAIILIVALVVKIGLNFVLIPYFSITGIAISTFCAYLLMFICNGTIMVRNLPLFYGWRILFLKPMLATFLMGVSVYIGERFVRSYLFTEPSRIQSAIMVFALIVLGLLVYGITILIFKGISKQELLRIPKIGKALVGNLERIGLLKRDQVLE